MLAEKWTPWIVSILSSWTLVKYELHIHITWQL